MKTLFLAMLALTPTLTFCAEAEKAPRPAAPAVSGTQDVRFTDGKATVIVTDTPVAMALEQLFKSAGKSYSILPTAKRLAEDVKVTLRIENVEFEPALKTLIGATGIKGRDGLVYELKDGVYVVSLPPPSTVRSVPLAPGPYDIRISKGKVTMALKDTRTDVALEQLFKSAGKSYNLTPTAAGYAHRSSVTLRIQNATFESALSTLMDATSLRYDLKNGIYRIMEPARYGVRGPVGECDVRYSNGRVTMTAKEAPADVVLEQLFKSAGKSYGLSSMASAFAIQRRTTLRIENAEFEPALKALVDAIGFSYELDSGVYQITDHQRTGGRSQSGAGECDVRFENGKVTLAAKNTTAEVACEQLFKSAGKSYTLVPRVSEWNVPVTLRLENADFESALNALVDAAGLGYRLEGGVYTIMYPPTYADRNNAEERKVANHNEQRKAANQASEPQTLVLITMNIPAMSVADAIAKIEPGWSFGGDLGQTRMPGAGFYNLPKGIAIGMTLIAAGLMPPTNGARTVSARGKSAVQALYRWAPPLEETGFVSYSGSFRGYGYGSSRTSPEQVPTAAVGAYKTTDGKWMFTVLASKATDYDILRPLFIVAGKNYVMSPLAAERRPTLSVQIYNATFDQVLDNVTAATGLKYRRVGNGVDAMYQIGLSAPANKVEPAARKGLPVGKSR